LGGGTPKALRQLGGEPLLSRCCRNLAQAPSVGLIVIAAPGDSVEFVSSLVPSAHVVAGGATRQESVAAALAAVPAEFEIILVHDAARALTPPELIEAVAAAVRDGHDAVIPALPVVDTIKRVDAEGRVAATVERAQLRAIQTPQGFRRMRQRSTRTPTTPGWSSSWARRSTPCRGTRTHSRSLPRWIS
jgi:2-C-methyl-D-erythritol 4-phosphate cytidylyltransferase